MKRKEKEYDWLTTRQSFCKELVEISHLSYLYVLAFQVLTYGSLYLTYAVM